MCRSFRILLENSILIECDTVAALNKGKLSLITSYEREKILNSKEKKIYIYLRKLMSGKYPKTCDHINSGKYLPWNQLSAKTVQVPNEITLVDKC